MASGEAEREVDSRVTCSVCLEPYKGRYPKLLPCNHTFCLPCLIQLAITAGSREQGKPSDSRLSPTLEEEEKRITCPTCRTVIPLPAGGVADFQSSFYVIDAEEDEHQQPTFCDLCDDVEQTANFSCSKCQHRFCARCQRIHDKFCDTTKVTEMGQGDVFSFADLMEKGRRQVRIIEEVLSQLSSREKKLEQRHQQIDTDINSHFAECLSQMINARDSCLKRLQAWKQTVGDKLRVQLTEAEAIHTKLINLFAEEHSLNKPSLSMAELRAGLQADDDLQRIRKNAADVDKEDFKYTPGTVSPNGYVDLVGTVEITRHTADDNGDTRDKGMRSQIAAKDTSQVYQQPLQKYSAQPQTVTSSFDPDFLVDKLKSMEVELSSLKDKSTTLGEDVSSLRAQNTQICQDLTELQTSSAQQHQTMLSRQENLTQLTTSNVNLSSGVKLPEENVSELDHAVGSNASLATDVAVLQGDVSALQQSVMGQSAKLARLEAQITKAGAMVAFHAKLDRSVTLNSGTTLICEKVIFSVGGGYDNQSGIFTAPVTGLYLFMATASPWALHRKCSLFLKHGDQGIGYIIGLGQSLSTCHAVIKVAVGEKVLLQTYHTNNRFEYNWVTSFSGMLVQREI